MNEKLSISEYLGLPYFDSHWELTSCGKFLYLHRRLAQLQHVFSGTSWKITGPAQRKFDFLKWGCMAEERRDLPYVSLRNESHCIPCCFNCSQRFELWIYGQPYMKFTSPAFKGLGPKVNTSRPSKIMLHFGGFQRVALGTFTALGWKSREINGNCAVEGIKGRVSRASIYQSNQGGAANDWNAFNFPEDCVFTTQKVLLYIEHIKYHQFTTPFWLNVGLI